MEDAGKDKSPNHNLSRFCLPETTKKSKTVSML
jgi:hypothetical protein